MANYIGIPILLVAAVLNATLAPEIRLAGGSPDLVFLLVISWALLADMREAMVWAVIGGLFQDWLSVAPLGTSALGLVIVVVIADSLFGRMQRANMVILLPLAVIGTVIYHVGILLVLRLDGMMVPLGRGLTYVTLPTIIYHAVLVLPFFRGARALHHWLVPSRTRVE